MQTYCQVCCKPLFSNFIHPQKEEKNLVQDCKKFVIVELPQKCLNQVYSSAGHIFIYTCGLTLFA